MSKSGRIHKNQTPNSSVLPTDSCLNSSMCKHNPVVKKRLPSPAVIVAHSRAPQVIAIFCVSHKISRCNLPLLSTLPLISFLQLLPRSVHREKCSNLSTVHSACISVSMFTINADNCLFLCSCFPRVSVLTSGRQPRHQIHQRLVTFIL